ncbi:alcohol dehydrogenase catalytic domain-containing protein [Pusillimonas sp. TS35]|uniref:zinc-dependent alcohol dehydrogenase n=1 Tax=Paracandidimonas lactea TaxID=2895524 RepID=UPI001368B321|nr:alcohol dehydrogenase catalytic domain-containing protein [Paracandidimonas lactea]MYN13927.1 alcohol dehydrogenase catalytic domain-containing protein [Pusillimonas sp. TS35]
MLAVRKIGPVPGISVENVAAPAAPEVDEVTIKVHAAGICGSDLHVYEWSAGYEFMRSRLPVTLGHEFSGKVVAMGAGVGSVSMGDRVAVMPTSSCLRCARCLAGNAHLCMDRKTVGLTRDGAFSQYVNVPAISCIKLATGTDLVLAALIEPLSVGDNAAEVGGVASGDTVIVLGPGTIGQAIIRAARWRGATRVIAVGMNDEARLRTAAAMGATDVIDLAATPSLKEGVLALMDGALADVVIEATGRASSISDGLSVLRKGGVLVTAGIHSQPVSFDLTMFVRNQQQLRAAHGSRRRSWEVIAQRIANEPESVRPMISAELDLKDAEEGFRRCLEREVSKVILRPAGA